MTHPFILGMVEGIHENAWDATLWIIVLNSMPNVLSKITKIVLVKNLRLKISSWTWTLENLGILHANTLTDMLLLQGTILLL